MRHRDTLASARPFAAASGSTSQARAVAIAASALLTLWAPGSGSCTRTPSTENEARAWSSSTMSTARSRRGGGPIGHDRRSVAPAMPNTSSSSAFRTATPSASSACTSSDFARATPCRSENISRCAAPMFVTTPTGPQNCRHRRDMPDAPGADLGDEHLGARNELAARQRHTELVVVRPDVRHDAAAAGDRGTDQVLGRRLAAGARDGDDLRIDVVTDPCAQPEQCVGGSSTATAARPPVRRGPAPPPRHGRARRRQTRDRRHARPPGRRTATPLRRAGVDGHGGDSRPPRRGRSAHPRRRPRPSSVSRITLPPRAAPERRPGRRRARSGRRAPASSRGLCPQR